MDTLLFFLVFAGAALVLGWYVQNELRGAPGTAGFLAIRADAVPDDDDAPAYRVRARRMRSNRADIPDSESPARYRSAAGVPGYRSPDGAGFRERAAGYREKTPRR